MDTASLKAFATKARTELIKEVSGRISVVLADNSLARVEAAATVDALERDIAREDLERISDRVAYTWFNRIIAFRFMDANGYTSSGVVSPAAGQSTGQPEVLAEAKAGVFDDAIVPKRTQDSITALFNGTRASQDRDGEAYGLLLEAYCRGWNDAMPFMFEREGDYTELLIPTALLAADSVRDRAVKTLTEDVCRDVEVIGWLYQFYISDRKDQVFEGFKKNKKAGAAEIPAATQLFTPHWIVRYLVENSLGRLWLLNNPSSCLAEQMDYYIKPVDEETDFLRIAKPEELKVIDPAVGSGHMLTYAFDLLYAIYTEKGYDPAEIPGLILEHNLYGVEIDPRAGSLAAFALTMKAAAKRKLFLKKPVQPNIRVLQNVHFDETELDYLWSLTKADGFARADADEFWNAFEHADTFGSLIQPKEQLVEPLRVAIEGVSADGDLFHSKVLDKATTLIKSALYLSRKYDVSIANPPYMSSKSTTSVLQEFLRNRFPASKSDLFAAFIERLDALVFQAGYVAMIAMQSWLFLTSYENLRGRVLDCSEVLTLAHFGPGAFDSIGGEVVSTAAFVLQQRVSKREGVFIRLTDFSSEATKSEALRRGASKKEESNRYVARSDSFARIPSKPFAYWIPATTRDAFSLFPSMGELANPRVGMQTSNNAKFLRYWWEVSASEALAPLTAGSKWITYLKGGPFRRWYGNVDLVLHYNGNPRHVLSQKNATILSIDRGLAPKVTWTDLSGTSYSARLSPPGAFHDIAGHSFYPNPGEEYWVLAYANSRVFRMYLSALNSTMHAQVGDVARIPVPPVDKALLAKCAERAVEISRNDWDRHETSGCFLKPELYREHAAARLDAAYLALVDVWDAEISELTMIERQIDELADPNQLSDWAGSDPQDLPVSLTVNPHFNAGYGPGPVDSARKSEALTELVSFAVGCMFGRYSLDKPGLILADQGGTLENYLAQVATPSFMPDKDNVIPIVDGDWFEDDIVALFRQFLRAAFGDEHFEENLRFVTESLGVKDIRDYFVKSFHNDHVKRYKKRPIYWLFRSPKGSFSALIYLHRYSPSTVSTVLTGYLREFIGKLEANLEHQGRVAAGMGSASTRDVANAQKEADRMRKVLVELRDYEHDILFPLAGQQIALDLDDGVLVNYQKLGAALKDIGLKKGNSSE